MSSAWVPASAPAPPSVPSAGAFATTPTPITGPSAPAVSAISAGTSAAGKGDGAKDAPAAQPAQVAGVQGDDDVAVVWAVPIPSDPRALRSNHKLELDAKEAGVHVRRFDDLGLMYAWLTQPVESKQSAVRMDALVARGPGRPRIVTSAFLDPGAGALAAGPKTSASETFFRRIRAQWPSVPCLVYCDGAYNQVAHLVTDVGVRVTRSTDVVRTFMCAAVDPARDAHIDLEQAMWMEPVPAPLPPPDASSSPITAVIAAGPKPSHHSF